MIFFNLDLTWIYRMYFNLNRKYENMINETRIERKGKLKRSNNLGTLD